MSEKVKFSEEFKKSLKAIFGTDIKEQGATIKTHVSESKIENDEIMSLAALVKKAKLKVSIGRSGTGLTILIN